jgi:hypothetical protein
VADSFQHRPWKRRVGHDAGPWLWGRRKFAEGGEEIGRRQNRSAAANREIAAFVAAHAEIADLAPALDPQIQEKRAEAYQQFSDDIARRTTSQAMKTARNGTLFDRRRVDIPAKT